MVRQKTFCFIVFVCYSLSIITFRTVHEALFVLLGSACVGFPWFKYSVYDETGLQVIEVPCKKKIVENVTQHKLKVSKSQK